MLIHNIKSLLQVEDTPSQWIAGKDMASISTIEDAFLFIEDGRIIDFGHNQDVKPEYKKGVLIDARGKLLMPSFCDSHTHLVYAGSRELEYVDKITASNPCSEIMGFGSLTSVCLLGNSNLTQYVKIGDDKNRVVSNSIETEDDDAPLPKKKVYHVQ